MESFMESNKKTETVTYLANLVITSAVGPQSQVSMAHQQVFLSLVTA